MTLIESKRVGDTVRFGQYIGVVVAIEGWEAVVEFKKIGTTQRIGTIDLIVIGSAA